ncbi:MAG: hypothetical protein IH841_07320, partial [Thaumarchaeota archaeon]|nr:hypothetical protein [Nitrososphaerota archaeon]
DYLKKVKGWKYKITSASSKVPSRQGENLQLKTQQEIVTGDNSVIGGMYYLTSAMRTSGVMYLLPPLKDSTDNLSALLESIGTVKRTLPPKWTEKIIIPNITDLENKIKNNNNEISKLNTENKKFLDEKQKLEKYKILLYGTDDELHDVVIDALKLLGLKNVRKGPTGKDDILFDPINSSIDIGTIEVKGVKNGVHLDDYRQLDHWVTNYIPEKKKVKGVMIANTHKEKDPKNSEPERMDFSNFEEFYKPRKLATLPTITLLKLVQKKLDGKAVDPKKIEDVLINTDDVIKIDDFLN